MNEVALLIIENYERRNYCFKSFLNICLDFEMKINNFNLEDLESFQKKRTSIIKVIEVLNIQTEKLQENQNLSDDLNFQKIKSKLFLENESTIEQILELDAKILTAINKAKEETVQKLHSITSGKKTLSAYRSPIDKIEAQTTHKIVDQEA